MNPIRFKSQTGERMAISPRSFVGSLARAAAFDVKVPPALIENSRSRHEAAAAINLLVDTSLGARSAAAPAKKKAKKEKPAVKKTKKTIEDAAKKARKAADEDEDELEDADDEDEEDEDEDETADDGDVEAGKLFKPKKKARGAVSRLLRAMHSPDSLSRRVGRLERSSRAVALLSHPMVQEDAMRLGRDVRDVARSIARAEHAAGRRRVHEQASADVMASIARDNALLVGRDAIPVRTLARIARVMSEPSLDEDNSSTYASWLAAGGGR